MNDLSLCVIPSGYPTAKHPGQGIFVKRLVDELAGLWKNLAVVAPMRMLPPDRPLPADSRDAAYATYRPRYLSCSSVRIGPFSTYRPTCAGFTHAVKRAVRDAGLQPDITYAHFLFPAAYAAVNTMRAPVAVGLGEGSFQAYEDHLGKERIGNTLSRSSGIVALSRENERRCKEYGVDQEKILFLPNAADTNRFYPRDKSEMRRKHNLLEGVPIIAFVGHFNRNKGPLRVLEAVRQIPEAKAIFLGSGKENPAGDPVLFAGQVAPVEVAEYLSAADVFVLPTIEECSPNAVAEAMACGCPVVASDIESVREMAGTECAVLVPPREIDSIRDSIRKILQDESFRNRLSENSLRKTKGYNLQVRAKTLTDWLTRIAEENRQCT